MLKSIQKLLVLLFLSSYMKCWANIFLIVFISGSALANSSTTSTCNIGDNFNPKSFSRLLIQKDNTSLHNGFHALLNNDCWIDDFSETESETENGNSEKTVFDKNDFLNYFISKSHSLTTNYFFSFKKTLAKNYRIFIFLKTFRI